MLSRLYGELLALADRCAGRLIGVVEAGACVPGAGTPCACQGDPNCVNPPDSKLGAQWYYDCYGGCTELHCQCCC